MYFTVDHQEQIIYFNYFSDRVDHTPELALSFIQESVTDSENRPQRGPFLAHLELIKQIQVSTEQPERSLGMSQFTVYVIGNELRRVEEITETIRYLRYFYWQHRSRLEGISGNIFIISPQKQKLWVLIRNASFLINTHNIIMFLWRNK